MNTNRIKIFDESSYKEHCISGCHGKNVSTRNDTRALPFQLFFDFIYDFIASQAQVCWWILLRCVVLCGVNQNWCITSLLHKNELINVVIVKLKRRYTVTRIKGDRICHNILKLFMYMNKCIACKYRYLKCKSKYMIFKTKFLTTVYSLALKQAIRRGNDEG